MGLKLQLMRSCKSPIEANDYAGLQLDTDAQERNRLAGIGRPQSTAKTAAFTQSGRAHCAGEKGYDSHTSDEESSPPPPAPSYEAPIPRVDEAMKETVRRRHDPAKNAPFICGLKRARFLLLLAVIFTIVVVAAVVGGVIGSRNSASASSSAPTPTAEAPPSPSATTTSDPVAVNAGLP